MIRIREFAALAATTAFAMAIVASAPATSTSAEVTMSSKTLTLDGAKKVAAAAVAEAKRLQAPSGAIAVVDEGGALLYLERLDNTFPAAAAVATEKARTAATFRRATS